MSMEKVLRIEIFGSQDSRIMVQETTESVEFYYPLRRNVRIFKRQQPKIFVKRLRLVEAA